MSSIAAGEADPLVELLKAKNIEAFAQLYDLYAKVLYAFICRTVPDRTQAEELLIEVFIRVWKDIDQYDPSKERLFTWLFRLTRNVCPAGTQCKT